MTVTVVRDRLHDRFRLLVGSQRGRERHQTLHHAVQWSLHLRDVLGNDPPLIASPGTYDQKHVMRIGFVESCARARRGVEMAALPSRAMNSRRRMVSPRMSLRTRRPDGRLNQYPVSSR